jgi:hypothetical protein
MKQVSVIERTDAKMVDDIRKLEKQGDYVESKVCPTPA